MPGLSFEQKLHVFRKECEARIPYDDVFVVCSMSSKTIVYKGQLTPEQVYLYFAAKIVLLVVQCAFTGSIILSGVLVGFTERC